ncbi:Dynamin family protein [Halobacillus dabanensis]|uniref:Dynamin family protein n=1 Tax=Halobacillus dabanensis TaxID=240302 RepID=A0A1I3VVW9_HALDA|nr:dynamin family protein [Halobacillus dabanensis]SFJ98467.1 Dynamin family protein [Halobacillus dabanensis]
MTQMTDMSINKIRNLYSFLNDQEFAVQREKLLDLYEKERNKEMVIGFAGHFSAGKSTMINTLLDEDLLPSSPIPTSANIVKLKSGDIKTVVHFQNGSSVKYEEEVDMRTIQNLCKDGETITGIEISRPQSSLPPHISVVDTPGVDSTNDADRLITESSLHLMDYMYYIMDYNHVQSEVNLMFLLEMQRRKTPFSIVINQVDKHIESELTFQDYRTSVIEAFSRWGIEPDQLYFTSMRDFSLTINDFIQLKEDFHSLFNQEETMAQKQLLHQVKGIAEEAAFNYSDLQEEEIQSLREKIEEAEDAIQKSPLEEEWMEKQINLKEEAEEDFQNKVLHFITNAYLIPSSLREYAELYLEAMQPEFKVGIFFSHKKTEEERLERKRVFHQKLNESIEQNLHWPVRERMLKLLEQFNITDSELIHNVQNSTFDYPEERLSSLVQPGASVTGAYVLRYTDEVAKNIRKLAKEWVIEQWRGSLYDAVERKKSSVKNQYASVFDAYIEKQVYQNRMKELNEKMKNFRYEMTSQMEESTLTDHNDQIFNDLEKRQQSMESRSMAEFSFDQEEKAEIGNKDPIPDREQSHSTVDQAIQKADETLKNIKGIDGLQRLSQQLENKRERLAHRQYTVALFGAFSAGKSSFANALLGDLILPVSPNPTTATINKISPPTEDKPNHTIEAHIKSKEEMLEDLTPILEEISINETSLDDICSIVEQMNEADWTTLDHKNHSFLRAFIEGYPEMKTHFGQCIHVDWSDFSSYVAKEEKSCFIESMELYYDCPWTRAGVTLVDTPGADSVNARHTDVSFEYIKDADAVLFVTYYNHPFSQADQSFLTQLGRVKDSFAMDKMFFLINAADLAKSDEELEQVENYVKEQLNSFQIRNPKMYSVSSLHALQEKQKDIKKHSGMTNFEQNFRSFLDEELAQMMIASIEEDVVQVMRVLESYIETSQMNEEDRRKEIVKVKEDEEVALQLFKHSFATGAQDALHNKVEKQMHYVHERMMLNFTDLFKRHYNPATIKKDGDIKEALMRAQENLLKELSFEMIQETKAVCIRMERFVEDLIAQAKDRMESELMMIHRTLKLSKYDMEDLPLPVLEGNVDIQSKEKAQLRKYFKNPKAFFERNEKEEMKTSMADLLSTPLKVELEQMQQKVTDHYVEQWLQAYDRRMEDWERDVLNHFTHLLSHLENPIESDELEAILLKIQTF